jgi:hypothetical protein
MNGALAAVTGLLTFDFSARFGELSAARQRRNSPALIPSRRQNSDAGTPLAACRENSSRQVVSLRFTRLVLLIRPLQCSHHQSLILHGAALP